MGSFSIWHWLIVLVIVVLVFGTKKLKNMGSDVGGAVKNFKDAMGEAEAESVELNTLQQTKESQLIEAELTSVPTKTAAKKKTSAGVKSPNSK